MEGRRQWGTAELKGFKERQTEMAAEREQAKES
jgi:hypothetical protein